MFSTPQQLKRNRGKTLPLFALVLLFGGLASGAVIAVDDALPAYEKTHDLGGNLNSIGSDTLNNLMALWAEAFRAIHPGVNIQVEGKGSSTAPPALIEGAAQLGPMSRPMKSSELDAFEARYNYTPTEIRVAVDALAVYVHKDNPLPGLTLQQLDGIFSSTHKRGGPEISTWTEVGMDGIWAHRPISLYGRNSASGTYGFFKERALAKGDFLPTVKEQPGSSSVVLGIAGDLYSIGYSGAGYSSAGVRAIALGERANAVFDPTPANALNGNYPLARFLLLYINKDPREPLDLLTREFIHFILSKPGQEIVVKDGYYPLPANIVAEELEKLN